jgi:hypothetical protein
MNLRNKVLPKFSGPKSKQIDASLLALFSEPEDGSSTIILRAGNFYTIYDLFLLR